MSILQIYKLHWSYLELEEGLQKLDEQKALEGEWALGSTFHRSECRGVNQLIQEFYIAALVEMSH